MHSFTRCTLRCKPATLAKEELVRARSRIPTSSHSQRRGEANLLPANELPTLFQACSGPSHSAPPESEADNSPPSTSPIHPHSLDPCCFDSYKTSHPPRSPFSPAQFLSSSHPFANPVPRSSWTTTNVVEPHVSVDTDDKQFSRNCAPLPQRPSALPPHHGVLFRGRPGRGLP
jgi:hypothetical protein